MLKRFFISMLGTMAGLWLSLIIIGFGFFIAVIALASSMLNSGTQYGKNNILHIELAGEIPERSGDMTLSDLMEIAESDGQTLSDILTSIKLAADDETISGIFLDCKGATTGVATLQEIAEALKDFKKSGKWIYAYGDNYEQGEYWVATSADKVFLNPVGSITVKGLASSTLFFKNLMDKLGVEAQVVKVGDYKSAVEPFIRTDMSEPSKEQTIVFLTQIWNEITNGISSNRKVTQEDVNQWADSISFTWAPEKYIAAHMADELKYRSEVENLMREKVNVKEKDELPLITPVDYVSMKTASDAFAKDKKHIAVLYAVGDIVDEGNGGIVGEDMVPEILRLAKDDNVAGLILRVNSGGGSAFASEQIWHALEDFKATGKPFYVSMGDYAASGGYYISCGANKIYADATTLTGSIGIFGIIPNAHDLITDKIGVNIQNVETNPNAAFPSVVQPATPEQLQSMQEYVERGYDTFTSRVAQGRNMPQDSVKAIGGGRVWDGISALKLGLVDQLAPLNVVIAEMAAELDIDAKDYINYPDQKEWWMQLISGEKPKVEFGSDPNLLLLKECLQVARTLNNISPMQARMEKVIVY